MTLLAFKSNPRTACSETLTISAQARSGLKRRLSRQLGRGPVVSARGRSRATAFAQASWQSVLVSDRFDEWQKGRKGGSKCCPRAEYTVLRRGIRL